MYDIKFYTLNIDIKGIKISIKNNICLINKYLFVDICNECIITENYNVSLTEAGKRHYYYQNPE